MPHKEKKFRQPHVTLTEAESAALQEAMGNFRQRTRKNISYADVLKKHGLPKFCADNGVTWPQESGK